MRSIERGPRKGVRLACVLLLLMVCGPGQFGAAQQAGPQTAGQRYIVLLDPAHGGSDSGALLGEGEAEKAFTLAMAARLRGMLGERGVHVISTRQSDVSMDNASRAAVANRSAAAACILLHATSTGTGVHLFTSSLPAPPTFETSPPRSFLPWETAQAAFERKSLQLESDINTALSSRHIPVLLERTSLAPLDSLTCPAVAVEVAPLNPATALTNADYQQSVLDSLCSALLAWRNDRSLQP